MMRSIFSRAAQWDLCGLHARACGHAEGISGGWAQQGTWSDSIRPRSAGLARATLERVQQELGSQAAKVTLIGEAFSSIDRHISRLRVDGLLGRLWRKQPAVRRGAQGIQFSGGWAAGYAYGYAPGPTAEQVVNELSERELANLIYENGEERRSRTVARAIVRGRPVTTTGQLARIVASAVPAMNRDKKQSHIHPATRTFQALRIYVNRELDEIRALLEAAPSLLKPSGRLVVISFHSLEDRIAKDSLREGAHKGIWEILTRKPVIAGEEETDRIPAQGAQNSN